MRKLKPLLLDTNLLYIYLLAILLLFLLFACTNRNTENKKQTNNDFTLSNNEYGILDSLSSAEKKQSATKYAKIIGWKNNEPVAASGLKVIKFADNLNSPRNIYVAPNGDIFVAQARTQQTDEDAEKIDSRNQYRSSSPDQVLRFQDKNKDGQPEVQEVFLENLNQPYGMLILNNFFYVANTDAVVRYPYDPSTGKIGNTAETVIKLPAGGYNNHWTRNLIASPDNTKIYISIGSASNVGEYGMDKEINRAAILEINPDGSQERLFASGLRNPVGMAIEPMTKKLWTAVNERDELGDELVPDYITSVSENGFYGWPYTYWGQHIDPRWEGKVPDSLAKKAIIPNYAIGSHTASLGLAFSTIKDFANGAYIGQHGSWNRSEFVGYKVIFIAFDKGKPVGQPKDILTGFIANPDKKEVYGRPVAVAFTDSYMLVSDDAANVIWAVLPQK